MVKEKHLVEEIIIYDNRNKRIKVFFEKSGSKDEKQYRYRCNRPTCIESAVLMVCDCIEAMSKARLQAGNFDPTSTINDAVTNLLDDGQVHTIEVQL
jgi:membrane-associated HD superfamily phosphohydrolase